jgi:hypothetical protein
MPIQVELNSFIEDVQKLHERVSGSVSLDVCMSIVKQINEEGYRISIQKCQPFIIDENIFVNIAVDVFRLSNTSSQITETIKIIKRKLNGMVYDFVIILHDEPQTKHAQVYLIDFIYKYKQ